MTIDEIKRKLESVLSPKRFEHSLGVMDTAINLAENMAGMWKRRPWQGFCTIVQGK